VQKIIQVALKYTTWVFRKERAGGGFEDFSHKLGIIRKNKLEAKVVEIVLTLGFAMMREITRVRYHPQWLLLALI
jgi:uncharacterized membrane protein YbaN (DUF454 family)